MNKALLRYVPKEYKDLVVDIYEGETEYNEMTKKWNTPLIIEWENGEVCKYQNKTFAREVLKEFHARDEFMKED